MTRVAAFLLWKGQRFWDNIMIFFLQAQLLRVCLASFYQPRYTTQHHLPPHYLTPHRVCRSAVPCARDSGSFGRLENRPVDRRHFSERSNCKDCRKVPLSSSLSLYLLLPSSPCFHLRVCRPSKSFLAALPPINTHHHITPHHTTSQSTAARPQVTPVRFGCA